MSDSYPNPSNTYAVIVGIEKYEQDKGKTVAEDLPGAASSALKFAEWLSEHKVPKENIFLFISELDENKDLVKSSQFNIKEATREKIEDAIFTQIRQTQGCILYIFWAGHGYTNNVDDRRLLYADAQLNLNLPSLLSSLKTDIFSGFNKQVLFIDACAVYAKYTSKVQYFGKQLRTDTYDIGNPRPNCEQVVLLATKEGYTANFKNNLGLFSEALLTELGKREKLVFPEEMKEIVENIEKEFKEGKYKDEQTPIHLYYRNRDGSELDLGLTKSAKISKLLEKRWNELLLILHRVNEPYVLYISCYLSLLSFGKKQDIIGAYPQVELLKSEENEDDRRNTFNYLKNIFLFNPPNKGKNVNQISRLYSFINNLLYLLDSSKEKTITNELKQWKEETNKEICRLNIDPRIKQKTTKLETRYKDFHPYLVITCQPKSSEKLYLSAELIFQKDSSTRENFPIITQKEIEITHIQEKFDSLLLFSYRIVTLCKFTKGNDQLIVEVFLSYEQLRKTSQECFEKIEIRIDNFSNDRKWVSCRHKFVLRSFERLANFDYTPISILRKKWDELHHLISNAQGINNRIEWICSENLNSESKRDIVGINLLYFSKDSINKSIKQVIQEGLPLFIWVREICAKEEVREEFENLLKVNNLDDLLENIRNKRLDAYQSQQQRHLGYHIGFLCDNPYRLPSYYTEDDNGLAFGA